MTLKLTPRVCVLALLLPLVGCTDDSSAEDDTTEDSDATEQASDEGDSDAEGTEATDIDATDAAGDTEASEGGSDESDAETDSAETQDSDAEDTGAEDTEVEGSDAEDTDPADTEGADTEDSDAAESDAEESDGLEPDTGTDSASDGDETDEQVEEPRLLAPGEPNPDSSPFALKFEDVVVFDPLYEATDLQMLPDSNEFVVITKDGWFMRYRFEDLEAHRLQAFEVMRDGQPLFFSEDDCGGIGLAVAPDYDETGNIYLSGCVSRTHSELVRMTLDEDDDEASMESLVTLLRAGDDSAQMGWHNIGEVAFDAEGNLFTFFGDKTVSTTAQDTANLLGTMVRILPTPQSGGDVPQYESTLGNPFMGNNERSEVYAYGLRSPWRGMVDNLGRYWIADVGANAVEEINIVSEPGQNFGWPLSEGPCQPGCDTTDPVLYWIHDDETGYLADAIKSTRDGAGYVGLQYQPNENDRYEGHLDNRVIFGDYVAAFVRVAEVSEDLEVLFDHHVGYATSATTWIQAPDGYIYTTRRKDQESDADFGTLRRAILDKSEE